MNAVSPTKQLITFQKQLRKSPETYFRRAFVDSLLSTMLLEGESMTREEIAQLSEKHLQTLSRHGYFRKFKS